MIGHETIRFFGNSDYIPAIIFIIFYFFLINNESFLNIFIINSQTDIFGQKLVIEYWFLLLILYFPSLQYKLSNLWLLLQDNFKMTFQPHISIIDSKNHHPHHSRSEYVNSCCFWKYIELLKSFLLQCKQMYKKYSASHKYHFLELIFCLT